MNNPEFINPRESEEQKYIRMHKEFVDSGNFDALPDEQISVGDKVAIRDDHRIHQVYEMGPDEIVVGFDFEGQSIRRNVNRKDVKKGSTFLKAYGKNQGISVDIQKRKNN